jgi:hypothetical protein
VVLPFSNTGTDLKPGKILEQIKVREIKLNPKLDQTIFENYRRGPKVQVAPVKVSNCSGGCANHRNQK